MARGITESDVHGAADALVASGERPTVERIRAHLGTGSPNTVVRWLDTWWQGLGMRLRTDHQARIASANLPEAVAALAGQWWSLALEHAQDRAKHDLAGERAALVDERAALKAMREQQAADITALRASSATAIQDERIAKAKATELERLVGQLQQQVDEIRLQRDTALQRAAGLESARESTQEQLQRALDTARDERERLNQQVRAIEDHAHTEIDRARQEMKAARQSQAVLNEELAISKRIQAEAAELVRKKALEALQETTLQRARVEALEAQLARLQDLPAALKAALQEHSIKTGKPARPRRRAAGTGAGTKA